MHAVIIARRKIGGGETAVFKICGIFPISAQQSLQAVVMPLGLQNGIFVNFPQFAYRAVSRFRQCIFIADDGTRIFFSSRVKSH